jgi:hypothetical protein
MNLINAFNIMGQRILELQEVLKIFNKNFFAMDEFMKLNNQNFINIAKKLDELNGRIAVLEKMAGVGGDTGYIG